MSYCDVVMTVKLTEAGRAMLRELEREQGDTTESHLLGLRLGDGAQVMDSMYNVHASMDMHRFSDRLRAFDRKFVVDKEGKCRSVTGRT